MMLKTLSATTETSLKIGISPVASLDMILFQKANNEGADQSVLQVFSRRGPFTLFTHSADTLVLDSK